jgi:hypothetical protein
MRAVCKLNPSVNSGPSAAVSTQTGAAWLVNNAILIQIVLFGILREYSSNNLSIISSIERHFT